MDAGSHGQAAVVPEPAWRVCARGAEPGSGGDPAALPDHPLPCGWEGRGAGGLSGGSVLLLRPARGVEGFRVLSTDYSAGVVDLRLGRAGRATKTLLLFSESSGRSPRGLQPGRAGPRGRWGDRGLCPSPRAHHSVQAQPGDPGDTLFPACPPPSCVSSPGMGAAPASSKGTGSAVRTQTQDPEHLPRPRLLSPLCWALSLLCPWVPPGLRGAAAGRVRWEVGLADGGSGGVGLGGGGTLGEAVAPPGLRPEGPAG